MNNVIVKTEWLQEMVAKNAANHRAVYDEAVVEFQKQAIEKLNELVEQIRSGKLPKYLMVPLPIPEEHSKDYTRALGMLSRHISDSIEIDAQTYAELVDDDWGWREQFIRTTANYANNSR